MKPEEKARENIGQLLEGVGQKIQDSKELNLNTSMTIGAGIYVFPPLSAECDECKSLTVTDLRGRQYGCREQQPD